MTKEKCQLLWDDLFVTEYTLEFLARSFSPDSKAFQTLHEARDLVRQDRDLLVFEVVANRLYHGVDSAP
jgi:hypothetical protein